MGLIRKFLSLYLLHIITLVGGGGYDAVAMSSVTKLSWCTEEAFSEVISHNVCVQ